MPKNIFMHESLEKKIIAIGGGEIKNKTTIEIDRYIASLIKEKANGGRGNALFVGTASHDSMPYFNSFRKTYTSIFDVKVEVALIVYGEMDINKIANKIQLADCIYIGGGDTIFMLEKWKQTGIDKLLIEAYNNGKIICGLSAGAICWFKDMYTDYQIMRGESANYVMKQGLGLLPGTMCPHYNEREKDFEIAMQENNVNSAFCVENNCAIEFVNGKFVKSISSGGKAYLVEKINGVFTKKEL